MDFLPLQEFHKCVARYDGEHKVKSFSCLDQYLAMAFAQLTYRESLRDIETCLRTVRSRLYHMGFRGKISRNTLARANQVRDCNIYSDFAKILIGQSRTLYAHDEIGIELVQTAYVIDSTTIDLCLALVPWASFRKHKAGIKLHTVLDLRGNIPTFVHISKAKMHDIKFLDHLMIEPGAFYIMDKAYVDFKRLYHISQEMAFFVTRAKRNIDFERRYSQPVDKTTGLRFDQIIVLRGVYTKLDYPVPLRRIGYVDPETKRSLVFLTNNFNLPALTIAKLYKARWQVELFFKWIKQHLRIKKFYGTSENAIKTQIWIALSVYVLVAIVKKKMRLNFSLYTILQILSISLFEKMPISEAFSKSAYTFDMACSEKQLSLLN
jgi:hypothetical protein